MRSAVVDFATAMENKLALKDPQHPQGWDVDPDAELYNRLVMRVNGLHDAILSNNKTTIKTKAVDVANFAMMLYNKQGAA